MHKLDPEYWLGVKDDFQIDGKLPYFPEESERCVEIPFVFSKIKQEKKVIDIGTSLADPQYFRGLLQLVKNGVELWGLDIVPISKVMARFRSFDHRLIEGITFLQGDIRDCRLADASFDLVLCVSVIEHVGFDRYVDAEDTVFDRPLCRTRIISDYNDWQDDRIALNEMVRIVRPGGRVLLTMPFGAGGIRQVKDSRKRWACYLEYNLEKWNDLKGGINMPVNCDEHYFKHQAHDGWREVDGMSDFVEAMETEQPYRETGVLCVEITRPMIAQ